MSTTTAHIVGEVEFLDRAEDQPSPTEAKPQWRCRRGGRTDLWRVLVLWQKYTPVVPQYRQIYAWLAVYDTADVIDAVTWTGEQTGAPTVGTVWFFLRGRQMRAERRRAER